MKKSTKVKKNSMGSVFSQVLVLSQSKLSMTWEKNPKKKGNA
jgi:hypothetical protein